MRGRNIKSILGQFANAHWEREVTTQIVREWIVKTIGLKFSVYVLGQHLSKHESFRFIKRTNKGRLYLVVSPLTKWMDELKYV